MSQPTAVHRPKSENPRALLALAALLTLAIFLIDILTPLTIAVAVLYVVVVLLVAATGSQQATLYSAIGCAVLTIFAFLFQRTVTEDAGPLARCVFSLLAVASTSLLAMRNLAKTAQLQEEMQIRATAEAALARSEAFLAEAQQLSQTGSIAMRVPDDTMTWSDEAYRIFGYDRTVTPAADLILARAHPEDLPLVVSVRDQMRRGAPLIDVRHRLRMPDGTIKHVHLVSRRRAAAPDYTEYVGALMDITTAVQTQQALQRTSTELAHVMRMTTLGELAASIAHEVTQPIAAIVTCGDSALRWLNRPQPDVGEATQSIDQMIRDARRSSDIIRQIRSMAQKRDPVYAETALDSLVRESIELMRRELQDHHVESVIDLTLPDAMICGDRVQLQQVLINLLMNAVQAMEGAGRPRRLWVNTALAESRQVQVTVRDAGKGIAPEDADRLFSAFFTTKAEGMGMGLSICRSIVEAHGGRIWADSPPEGGAAFHIMLPLHLADAADGECAALRHAAEAGSEHGQ
ncbi:Adaptive-response sensory-kinase SasA [Cupriavidus campinensis]|uniref:histidine kinase n=1 Tax=Cupriavidus campinensis TaxID=151783 RepID=A0AAE9L4L1_9BURK|nr:MULTISPECIES: ATP-binding protein [Cupriavidus]TSP12140.1 PAS domain-containing sensor histidine kinase [Cupriavidus campinensis]URF06210.1 ATP-binding protein [Cupriavidus campinensis]CAG2129605.1 Adaptive-response sensory-kinase SasA [Cupriavidus campinensis]